MKVAIETDSTNDINSVRGVGTYTQNLISALKEKSKEIQIIPFSGHNIPKTDIVHYPTFDLFFHKLPLIKKIPRVVTIHDVIPLVFPAHYPVGPKGRANFFLQKLALKNTDVVITDSLTSKKDISRLLSYPNKKIHVVYLAASPLFKPIEDDKKLSVIKKRHNLPDIFFIYVGDVNWNKNVDAQLMAVKETGINLVLVGKALTDVSLEPVKKINKQIDQLKINSKITKTGYVPNADLCVLYNLAQATIVPSFYEGFGLPVVESMACGTPVICANNSSLSEVAGKAAILFNPNDPTSLSEAINNFRSLSDKQRSSIAIKSIEHAKKYSWNKVAEETLAVYKNILGK